MHATMMHYPMSVQMLFEHGRRLHPESRIGTFDGAQLQWRSYASIADESYRLASALHGLGVGKGDRVATFSWNNNAHFAAYLAIPSMGAVMHTVNIRLSPEQIAWIINDAGNKVVLIDASLADLFKPVIAQLESVEHLVVIGHTDAFNGQALPVHDYSSLIEHNAPFNDWPQLDETQAAAVCYTSGTTGNPKGVVYSHRTTFVHSMASRAVDTFAINERDRILLLPAMFHANAWGFPYSGWMSGSDFILPGPHLQAPLIANMVKLTQPTLTAMVPTILGDLLRRSVEQPIPMECFRMLVCGGSAVPPSMIEQARSQWGVPVVQGWGMTETSPMCVLSHPPRDGDDLPEAYWRAKSGRPVAGVEVRVVDDQDQPLPHDGCTVGELQLRGPWITGRYHDNRSPDAFTTDGWLRTGDVGHIDQRGFVQLTDRTKDVIKSGGEWISSVDLENVLVGHQGIREAAVIGIPDERWQERPLVLIVCEDNTLTPSALRAYLKDKVARFWLPEYWCFVNELAKTSVGKIDKKQLRAEFQQGLFAIETCHD